MQILLKDFGVWATFVLPKVNTPALAALSIGILTQPACGLTSSAAQAGGIYRGQEGTQKLLFHQSQKRGAGWEILDSPSLFLDAHHSQLVS